MKIKLVKLALIFLLFILSMPGYLYAAFSLSVQPYEGGYDLRFGKIDTFDLALNKEIIVTVTSDLGKQYRLIQTLLEPLTNTQGLAVSSNSLSVYAIRGSNKYGTVSVEHEIPVSSGRSIIYTSNATGISDSFKLVYVLKGPFDVPTGSYRGRIAFSLEPIEGDQSPVTVILNMFADIEAKATIEITTANGSKVIGLTTSQQDSYTSDVIVNIKNNFGSQFRISQVLSGPIISGDGRQLPFEAVNFKISEEKKGSGPDQGVPLSLRQETVYSSGLRGEMDNFAINYSLADPEKQIAGKYRAGIKYLLEGLMEKELLDNFNLEVEIAPVFDLIISPELGGVIQFNDVRFGQPPKISQVLVEVKNNTGKQYQVSQQLIYGLANKDGKAIPAKYFTLRQEGIETRGKLQFTSPAEVKTGEMVLFVSDREGSADKFRIIYELAASAEIIAGDYSGRISYTISEI